MSIVINDITPLDQFIATNLQTVFNVTWTAELTTDVVVYARATGTTANDINDIIAPADYTVAFIGGTLAVRVTFAVGRTTGDIVTITRDTTAQRANLYVNTNFTPTMLNSDFALSTFIQQQNEMAVNTFGPRYNKSATLEPTVLSGAPNPGNIDRIMPILGVEKGWIKNAAGTAIVTTTIPEIGAGPLDATYITQTPDTYLTNEQALSLLGSGIMVSTTATGVVNTRILTGTPSQIDVANGGGSGNPTLTISSTLDAPGTFTIGTSQVISAIINDSTQASALSTNISSALAMKTYIDNSSGASKVDSVSGTANQIEVNNADPINPIVKLPAVINVPGTFNIQSTTAISAIIDDDTMGTAAATNVPTSESVVAYVNARTPTLTNGQLWIGDTGNPANASTLTAGTGITIGNTAGAITISSGGAGYSWTEVTGTTQTMVASNGYILNNAGLVTATLPVTASVGDTLILQGKGAGLYRIAQNAGQTIHFGSSDTTTGVGGYIEATNRYDSIELVCITANSDWAVLTGPQGSLTIV